MKGALTNKELIWNNVEFSSQVELFKEIADDLCRKGYVKGNYQQEILAREKLFPTGLALEGYNVGIPHCDFNAIEREFVGVVILKKPIEMYQMDVPTNKLSVRYVFFLGFKNSDTHLRTLKQIMKIIKNKSLIESISKSESCQEINDLINAEIRQEDEANEKNN